MFVETLKEFKKLMETTKDLTEQYVIAQAENINNMKDELDNLVADSYEFEKLKELERACRHNEKMAKEDLEKLKEKLNKVSLNAESRSE